MPEDSHLATSGAALLCNAFTSAPKSDNRTCGHLLPAGWPADISSHNSNSNNDNNNNSGLLAPNL